MLDFVSKSTKFIAKIGHFENHWQQYFFIAVGLLKYFDPFLHPTLILIHPPKC